MKNPLTLYMVLISVFVFSFLCGCTDVNPGGESSGVPAISSITVLGSDDFDRYEFFSGEEIVTEIYPPASLNVANPGFSLALIEISPGNGTPPHYLLGSGENIYIISGSVMAEIDGISHEVDEGQAFFIPAGSVQSVMNNGGGELVYLSSVQPAYNPDVDVLIEGDIKNMTYKSHPEIIISTPESNQRWDPSEGCVIYAVMNPGMMSLSENELLPDYSIAHAEMAEGSSIPSQVLVKSDELDYVLEGEITVISDGAEYSVSKGQAIFIPMGVEREFKNSGKGNVRLLSYVNPYWNEETVEYIS